MKIAYIAGPYRSKDGINGIHQNIQNARDVAVALWQKGYAVICPHLNSAFMDGIVPDSVFLEGDLSILKRCDLIVMMEGWEESTGARGEYALAREYGIPVHFWPEVPDAS